MTDTKGYIFICTIQFLLKDIEIKYTISILIIQLWKLHNTCTPAMQTAKLYFLNGQCHRTFFGKCFSTYMILYDLKALLFWQSYVQNYPKEVGKICLHNVYIVRLLLQIDLSRFYTTIILSLMLFPTAFRI